MLKIGCHLSTSKGFYEAGQEIVSLGGNTFQYFSRNPRGGAVKAFDEEDFVKYLKFAQENQIQCLLTHAPYTLNPCSDNLNTREFALKCFREDLLTLDKFPYGLYNFHPGSHVGQGKDVGIELIIKTLNEVITPELKSMILLETMSGKGSEIGSTFEELKAIIDGVKYSEKLGVCLDTCHVYSAGYDIVNDLEGVIKHFDETIGINKLKAIHLNDSLVPYNSHKDRHEKIGEGSIGLKTIIEIINHPRLKDLLIVLETPNDEAGYAREIKTLKDNYK